MAHRLAFVAIALAAAAPKPTVHDGARVIANGSPAFEAGDGVELFADPGFVGWVGRLGPEAYPALPEEVGIRR